jgi:hypothetical protein
MDDFGELVRQQSDYKKKREDKFKNDSKNLLSKTLRKKVETTMIGALSSIEEHLSFLWDSNGKEPTPEQQMMLDLYQKVRSEILDKGNTQARNIDAELSQYEVNWLRNTISIPVKPV